MQSTKIIDSHVHLSDIDGIPGVLQTARELDFTAVNLVCISEREHINANPAAFVAKGLYPDSCFVFAGLDLSSIRTHGNVPSPPLDKQIDTLIQIGADGLKMLEGKPDCRKELGIGLDHPELEPLFARLEETRFPLVLHIADPEEFWDPALLPVWAAEAGWGYDDSFPSKGQLYLEVERILKRHPLLRVVFPHFMFLSRHLSSAAGLLDTYPGVHLDLAPGIELLYNLSEDPEFTREFFMRYYDRILFGTDIDGSLTLTQAKVRSEILCRWLSTEDEFRLPAGADMLLGKPEDGIMRGISLPEHILDAIMAGNFERFVSLRPSRLHCVLAAEEMQRQATSESKIRGIPVENTTAAQAAVALATAQVAPEGASSAF